jgi:hypothetical protein
MVDRVKNRSKLYAGGCKFWEIILSQKIREPSTHSSDPASVAANSKNLISPSFRKFGVLVYGFSQD